MKQGAPEPIAALNRIRILETGEPLVDIRDLCPLVEVDERSCPYLRRTVAEMLNRAASQLPEGHRFRAGTALRTLSMQKRGWDGYFQRVKEAHPQWPLSALRRATNQYFAPYDQLAPPGHCTGAAVDVILLGPDGEPMDVTSPTEGWEAAYTWSDRISPQAKHNRMILVSAMLTAGFSNCREEYWHYSWGDSAWAVRVGERTCPYGLIAPPAVVEARFTGARAAEIRQVDELAWSVRCAAEGLRVGLFWAHERPVSLRVEAAPETPLWMSPDREHWEMAPAGREGDAWILMLTPTTERVYLTTDAPPS